ncbi:MAG: phosphatidate cytidylyltransferase [Ktedonobacterales bacterium]
MSRDGSPVHIVPAEASSSRAAREWLASLGQRFATAFILMPIVIALAWFGGWVAFGGAALTVVLGLWELRAMLAQRGWHPIMLLCGAICLDLLLAAMLPAYRLPLLGLGISALIVGSFCWLMLSRQATLEGSLTDWALTVALPFYLGWPLAAFLVLRGGTPGYGTAGFWWTLTVLFTVWAFDTFAFFAGRFWGRTKLAPLISPKKSWEGVAGGLVLALIAAVPLTRPIGVPWYHALIIGVLVSIAATVGDLAESLLKRDIGVKDSGTLMRGHGGVLDRIDSLLFAVLVVLPYAVSLGAIRL